MKLTWAQLLANKEACRNLVLYHVAVNRRLYTADWPVSDTTKWWYPTALPGQKLGIELDDARCVKGKSRNTCVFDVDGTDDDAEVCVHVCCMGSRLGQPKLGWEQSHNGGV